MKAKHTQGLWKATGYDIRIPSGRFIAYTGPHHTGESEYPESCRIEDEANAARIADCVNACAGIENPGEAIQAARGALWLAVEVIEATGPGSYPEAETIISEALAKLKGAAE